jgi:hypothetical protein
MAVTIVDQQFDLYATGLLGCGAATRVTVAARASAGIALAPFAFWADPV